MSLRSFLGRYPAAHVARRRLQAIDPRGRALSRLGRGSFDDLPPPAMVRLAYQTILRRDPDPTGLRTYTDDLRAGRLTPGEFLEALRGSDEFQTRVRFSARNLGPSIHTGRCQFIRSLPPARRIVDLGGTHLRSDEGALVGLGYPYEFDELVIIDLPSDERHQIYRGEDGRNEVRTRLGRVVYRYHSMTDLSGFDDASVDLVYSGQSIEHVSPDEGDSVLAQAFRILRPGGHVALDTPNARVTRMQQAEFIDPDHKVEYTHPEFAAKLRGAGFEIVDAKGLNYAGPGAAHGQFDPEVVAGNCGLHAAIEDCYILCYVARKPEAPA